MPAPANSSSRIRQCPEADREGRRKAESLSGHDQAGDRGYEQRAESQGDTPDDGQSQHGDGHYRYENDSSQEQAAGRIDDRPEAGSQAKTRIYGQQHHREDQSYSGTRLREVQEVSKRRYTESQGPVYTLGPLWKK